VPDLQHLTASQIAGAIITAGAVIGVLAGFAKWGWPRWRELWRRVSAALDSVAGRDEIVDPTSGKVLATALPGIGVRMADMEDWRREQVELMKSLTEAVTKLADQAPAIADLERRVANLEAASAERVIGKVEAVKALDVIQTAMNTQPPLDAEADED